MKQLFGFPDTVNETSARLVAAGVVILTITQLITGAGWLLLVIAYGFVARVLTGPTLSPLGLLATRALTPRITLDHRLVPGPPKRFAQGIGLVLSVSAAFAFYGLAAPTLASVLTFAITAAATLEAVFGFCLGCVIFNLLMRVGVIPDSICEACAATTVTLGRIEPQARVG